LDDGLIFHGARLDEIVVTAERRESPLQRTPLSVSVAAQPLLAARAWSTSRIWPSSRRACWSPRPRTRPTPPPASAASAPWATTRVWRARSASSSTASSAPATAWRWATSARSSGSRSCADPQSTLFGQNTSAGVINVVTAGPSFDFGATGEVTVGDHGTRGGSVSVTGPLIEDKLAGRLYASVRRRDGLYDVRTGNGPRTETDDQNEAYETVRGQLLWTPSDSISHRLSADFTHRDERCCIGVQQSTGPTAGILALLSPDGGVMNPADPSARTGYANRDTNTRIKDGGVSLHTKIDTRSWASSN
jgi:iron complex outermembrane receptor protein